MISLQGMVEFLKAYMFIVWFYLVKNIYIVKKYFLQMYYIATFNGGCQKNCVLLNQNPYF